MKGPLTNEAYQEIAEVIDYAKKSRADCTTMIAFVVLRATGMLPNYFHANKPEPITDYQI